MTADYGGEYSGSYETGDVIGEGTFGTVALSRKKADGLEVILSRFKLNYKNLDGDKAYKSFRRFGRMLGKM